METVLPLCEAVKRSERNPSLPENSVPGMVMAGGGADRDGLVMVGVEKAGKAPRVAIIGHGGKRRLAPRATRGVAAGRRRVLGGGDCAAGHDHHLAGRVVGGGHARRCLVL